MKVRNFDSANYLKTNEQMAAYFDEMLQDGNPEMIAHAVGVIARAKGMTQIAKETGLSREGLYKVLSGVGNPELSTLLKVINAVGIKLHATVG